MKPHIRVGIIGSDGSRGLTMSALTAAIANGAMDPEGHRMTMEDINIVDLPGVSTQEAELALKAMADAKDFEKVIIVDSLSSHEEEKRRRDRERSLLDAKVAMAGMMAMNSMTLYPGHHRHRDDVPFFRRPAPVKMVKCDLPRCNVMHSHNGGYCCPEHCKEHRGK